MDYKFKTKPYAHQLKALEMSWDKSYFAHFMEMGTGKSKVLIDNIAMLYDAGKINGVLIVAPKGVVKTWYEQEIPTHLVDHIPCSPVLWQAMITQKQQRQLDTLFQTGHDYIYIDSAAQQTRFDFAQNYDISTINAKKSSFRWYWTYC